MSSVHTQTVNVSVDNVKSFIISGLYSLGVIKFNDNVLDITFGKAADGLGLDEFKEWRADRIMPLKIKFRKEETEVNGKEGS